MFIKRVFARLWALCLYFLIVAFVGFLGVSCAVAVVLAAKVVLALFGQAELGVWTVADLWLMLRAILSFSMLGAGLATVLNWRDWWSLEEELD